MNIFQHIFLSIIQMYFSQPTNISFNQSSAIHTMFFINYSHLLKTHVIHYDLNHINIIYCQPYPPQIAKRVSFTECHIMLTFTEFDNILFLYFYYMNNCKQRPTNTAPSVGVQQSSRRPSAERETALTGQSRCRHRDREL